MAGAVWFVLAIALVALTFDFINGFHDSANSIATIVSTRVLSPGTAAVSARLPRRCALHAAAPNRRLTEARGHRRGAAVRGAADRRALPRPPPPPHDGGRVSAGVAPRRARGDPAKRNTTLQTPIC